jgi:hypothetical protein
MNYPRKSDFCLKTTGVPENTSTIKSRKKGLGHLGGLTLLPG